MKPVPIFVLIFIEILCVCAKINGGPRGRFDNDGKYHHHVSAHHAHYSYHPPTQIYFACRYCSTLSTYPVYHGLPPTYVYKYKETESRFSDLLTGLALYNLGRSASDHWHYTHYYMPRRNANCSMQVVDPSHFEETPFPCFMMSSFMERAADKRYSDSESLLVDITSSYIDVKSFLQNNGTPLVVTRSQECVLWHNLTMFKERNHIPCALLNEYSKSMKPSGLPVYIWFPILLGTIIFISVCCQCCKKNKTFKEEAPLTQVPVIRQF